LDFIELADKTKAKLDLPFDQIYHREKFLIDRVA
jgi:RNA recognition motif-containing protein